MNAALTLILHRLVYSLGTLALVSVIIFAAVEVLPGDIPSRILGREAPLEAREKLRVELGLNRPAVERYFDWAAGALRGDFGTSISARRPVADMVWARLSNTLALAGLALLIYIPLSIIPALVQALYANKLPDRIISTLTVLVLSTPEFLLATLLLFGLAVALPLFPPLAQVSAATGPLDFIRIITLPALSLAILLAVYGTRLLRESLIELLDSDFIRMAELKGLPRRRIILRHALPNALIPWLNATAINFAFMIGGVVVVERVFIFPGFGSLLVDALQLRDIPLIEASVLIAAFIFIAVNLLADIGAILLNPKLRT
ncbi:ABC transporter permease [Rhodoligotrophos defluvii]|uniref:ABC transporter permease n=1 Tax=Rhodoligotrophos defluvii TaxID=2561934 RepID=UPI0010C96EC5|nr:ABC transporter permease [Rhodoligotrophos defluvii]